MERAAFASALSPTTLAEADSEPITNANERAAKVLVESPAMPESEAAGLGTAESGA
jgi:hypothetical protein